MGDAAVLAERSDFCLFSLAAKSAPASVTTPNAVIKQPGFSDLTQGQQSGKQ
jgi:hypothetical protein